MRDPKQNRREFIEGVTLGTAAAGVLVPLLNKNATAAAAGEMPYRPLGRTGEKVSLLGLGGAHFGTMMPDEEYASRFIRTAIDEGVNFVESSWDYDWGLSEYRIGQALRDGYRQKVFLATKIDGRTKPYAEWQLNDSLHRSRADTIDLEDDDFDFRPHTPHRLAAAGRDSHSFNGD